MLLLYLTIIITMCMCMTCRLGHHFKCFMLESMINSNEKISTIFYDLHTHAEISVNRSHSFIHRADGSSWVSHTIRLRLKKHCYQRTLKCLTGFFYLLCLRQHFLA